MNSLEELKAGKKKGMSSIMTYKLDIQELEIFCTVFKI